MKKKLIFITLLFHNFILTGQSETFNFRFFRLPPFNQIKTTPKLTTIHKSLSTMGLELSYCSSLKRRFLKKNNLRFEARIGLSSISYDIGYYDNSNSFDYSNQTIPFLFSYVGLGLTHKKIIKEYEYFGIELNNSFTLQAFRGVSAGSEVSIQPGTNAINIAQFIYQARIIPIPVLTSTISFYNFKYGKKNLHASIVIAYSPFSLMKQKYLLGDLKGNSISGTSVRKFNLIGIELGYSL